MKISRGELRKVESRIAAAASVLVAVLAVAPGASAQEMPQEDPRAPVVVPEQAREVVLWEMRRMLRALNGSLAALNPLDPAALAAAARSGGTAIAVDADPAVMQALPEPFVTLGMRTHRGFDALAEAAEAGASRDSLVARMARLTDKCVACHATWRLETQEAAGR